MNTRSDGEELISGPIDVDSMTAEERTTLGPLIRRVRESKGMTAIELAAAADIDRKTLRSIENGGRAGQPAKLHAILEALGISQVKDYDRFSERTRSFIYATAPIFDHLPEALQDDAQHDVVVLLTGKLARSADIPTIGVGTSQQDRRVAFERSEDRGEDGE
ncbi:helix-turn-helix transcriptional regulator [Microbacterium sp. PM5]|uniref:helix-turn-helix domain-containing protein n=1 Tax=Microbacterium sp. PM5 TaxID=2014534 RepID=UPI0013AFD5A9|nr:helix-turn-helix transcriptional regulator [Microbacterium sp. PM5]